MTKSLYSRLAMSAEISKKFSAEYSVSMNTPEKRANKVRAATEELQAIKNAEFVAKEIFCSAPHLLK